MTQNDMAPRKRKFVAAMLTSSTIEEAANAVGVTKRTGMRYVSDPAVRSALNTVLDATLSQVTRRVVASMGKALDTLERIHLDEEAPAGSRVSAARAILDAGPRLREFSDLCERVAELEARLNWDG